MKNQMSEDKRTVDNVLKSFVKELNEKGADLDYDKLNDQEKLELMALLMEEITKHMRPYVVHVLGYQWYWFHDLWFERFKKYDVICCVAARGEGKSFFWSRMLPSYLQFINNNFLSIISSFNETATFNFLKGIRQDYDFNEVLSAKVSSSKASDWNKSTLDLQNGSSTRAISITSQIRSIHANYFSADDIINDEQKLTPEQIKTKIFATILPTLRRKRGKFVLIGTRFTEDDIYSFFKEKAVDQDNYCYIETRVELDEKEEKVYIVKEDEYGNIERREDKDGIYDYNDLLSLKIVEPNLFAREYECKVVSDDDVPFPLSKLLEARDKELSYELIGDPKRIYMAGLDFSNSTRKDADDTVLCIGYKDSDNNTVVANIFSDNKYETPERMKQIKQTMDKFNKVKTLAEQNSMGLTNIQTLTNEGYRVEAFYTDRNKKTDITDYASIQVKLGKVRFPYKTARDQKITDKLIHQLSGVRQVKTRGGLPTYTGTTKHDDFYIGFILMMKQLSKNENLPTKIKGFKRKDLY